MHTQLKQRAYRKTINSHGRIYFGDEAGDIAVHNISTSGILVGLSGKSLATNNKHTLEGISLHKPFNFCIPPLRLSGRAKIARMFTGHDLQLFLGMEFQDLVSCGSDAPCTDSEQYYISRLEIPGRLLLDGCYFDFLTVNMSANDLIIRLPLMIGAEKGMLLEFEFTQANIKGWFRVVWTLEVDNFETLMRLQYVKRKNQGDDLAGLIDRLLPHPEDCPITHRLRIFAAMKETTCNGREKISASLINLAADGNV